MPTDEFPADTARWVQEYIEDRHDFLAWLNTTVDAIDYGRVVMTVPFDEKLTNKPPAGEVDADSLGMHGGVAATLIDTAGGVAQRTMLDDPLDGGVVTVNLNVNYLRRASGNLTATADVVRAGGSIGVSTVTVESPTPEGGTEAVATGQAAYRLFR
ncbi:uncharacterized domain 1-containing protein [Halogranum amylolyticum]|uniref:Uncharacterized domain 1-containing protein n=1 Tax=Halogranum amylolyticum TaxID=660520 RepID=A0A1H8TVB0_9EURY|nr:PaaI family thioesterase [Halogranum amylolyticum]SEO94358.1 uncharacterized domain 1-containing protein [Halogranum amylolyticum]